MLAFAHPFAHCFSLYDFFFFFLLSFTRDDESDRSATPPRHGDSAHIKPRRVNKVVQAWGDAPDKAGDGAWHTTAQTTSSKAHSKDGNRDGKIAQERDAAFSKARSRDKTSKTYSKDKGQSRDSASKAQVRDLATNEFHARDDTAHGRDHSKAKTRDAVTSKSQVKDTNDGRERAETKALSRDTAPNKALSRDTGQNRAHSRDAGTSKARTTDVPVKASGRETALEMIHKAESRGVQTTNRTPHAAPQDDIPPDSPVRYRYICSK